MAFPFYIPGIASPRVVIVGGGYAGVSAAVTLREHCPLASITLIDPRHEHLKITHLHESFRRPFVELSLPFTMLEKRLGIRHLALKLLYDEKWLSKWNDDRVISVGKETLEFDYLLIASGTSSPSPLKYAHTLTLDDFVSRPGPELLLSHLNSTTGQSKHITVIGGGATGIQFLFEIDHFLRLQDSIFRLRLVDYHTAPLSQFNSKIGHYVMEKMASQGIEYMPNYLFRGQEEDRVRLENRETEKTEEMDSDLTLLFVGRESSKRLDTNWFGQVVVDGCSLERVFSAGDCSQYRMPGSNALSAQTAVRKGKLAARNILRHSGRVKLLEPYLHQDMGYVISLGPKDSIGWIGFGANIVGGQPAAVVKEIVEAQYDLLLAGVDIYLM